MQISRRLFLKYCGASSLVLASCGIDSRGPDGSLEQRDDLASVLPPGAGARVIWLTGSGCGGCSVSFLNRFSTTAPVSAADVLMNVAVVGFQPVIMAAAGDQAVAAAEAFYAGGEGTYVLVVEGAIPTAFNGAACVLWRDASGQDVTVLQAVQRYAASATAILSIGTCAAYGGVSAASPNPGAVQGLSTATGLKTINIPGCPPHPDWIVAGLAGVLSDAPMSLDTQGRPESIYGSNIHVSCPRNQGASTVFATTHGVDNQCLRQLGCRGPVTTAPCPSGLWNNGRNWCVDANGPCVGCTESSFPQVGLRTPV